jgi:predicted RNA-binding Zn-ribbon protein involved in translation (DUF1610 family)
MKTHPPRCPNCGLSDRWHLDAEIGRRYYVRLDEDSAVLANADEVQPERTVVQVGHINCDACGWDVPDGSYLDIILTAHLVEHLDEAAILDDLFDYCDL